MNGPRNLIPINKVKCATQNHDQSLCNARDLHAFLEVRKDFSNWIKGRIQQHGFVENQDFIVFAKIGENPNCGRPSTEYHITIEAAKHISMAEHTPKGKEAHQYFIECERIVLEELRRMPADLPSLDELPICMCLPEDVAICCVSDDGSVKTGFKMDSWSNRREPRLVIGFETRRFNAMSDSKIDPPLPDVFGLPLWIEMRGRYAFVWTAKKSPQDPETRVINLPHAKTLIIGLPEAIDDLIYERGYSITPILTREYEPWNMDFGAKVWMKK